MGWGSGTYVFHAAYAGIRKHINEDQRIDVAYALVQALRSADWDCVDEMLDDDWPELREVYFKIYGEYPCD